MLTHAATAHARQSLSDASRVPLPSVRISNQESEIAIGGGAPQMPDRHVSGETERFLAGSPSPASVPPPPEDRSGGLGPEAELSTSSLGAFRLRRSPGHGTTAGRGNPREEDPPGGCQTIS